MSKESAQWLATNTLVGFGRQAWHFDSGLGSGANHFDGPIPQERVRELLVSADVVSVPVFARMADGTELEMPNRQGIARADGSAVHAVMSDGYTIHQHTELLDGMGTILASGHGDTDGLGIGSAGLLENGAVAWVSVSLADSAITASGVEFVTYLLAYGSANGRHATTFKLVNQLVVCDNTLAIAGQESGATYRVKHTANSLPKVRNAREALGIILDERDATDAAIQALCETPVSAQEWDAMLAMFAPIADDAQPGRGLTMAENKRDALHALYSSDARVTPWHGTAFGALQAHNTYMHWAATGTGTGVVQARNMTRVLTGKAAESDQEALSIIHRVLSNA